MPVSEESLRRYSLILEATKGEKELFKNLDNEQMRVVSENLWDFFSVFVLSFCLPQEDWLILLFSCFFVLSHCIRNIMDGLTILSLLWQKLKIAIIVINNTVIVIKNKFLRVYRNFII